MILRQGNNVLAAGRVTRDAELKEVGEKKSLMAKFGVAVADKTYVNVVAWRQIAEDCRGIVKGDTVAVYGTEEAREYNGREYKDVTAEMVCRRPHHSDTQEPEKPKGKVPEMGDMQEIDEDMPF